MKRAIFLLVVFCDISYGYCLALYNQHPTCTQVANLVSNSIMPMLKSFNSQREKLILEPTGKLNERAIKLNLLNGKVYEEQQAIMFLDNQIAQEMERQNFLLEKLANLKNISNKGQDLLLKSEGLLEK